MPGPVISRGESHECIPWTKNGTRQAYPDVAEAIASGEIASAHAHYNMTGYFEGRAPDPQTAEMVRQWQQILGPTLNGVSQDVTSPAPEPLGFSRPNSAKTIPRGRAASR